MSRNFRVPSSGAAPLRAPLAALHRPARRLPTALAAWMACCASASAQTPVPAAPAALPEVTVTSSGLSLGATDMTTPVSVLEGDTLVRQRGATLGETLESEPGVQATHFGAGASRPIVRGMDGPRVQIVSDGAELHDASTVSPDHAVASEPLLARQIEVLRGPSALVHSAGAVGGVVNVLDGRVPTQRPAKAVEGSAELRAASAAGEGAAAFELTTGAGPLVLHAEGARRSAGDYRVGRGWAPDGTALGRVPGSFSRGDTGSVGLSWVGDAGYLGLAYTRQTARYGLPGHQHGLEGCHTHGNRLHCGSHAAPLAGEEDAHTHDRADVPVVDLLSERLDVRGEWRRPAPGIAALRLRAGSTDYRHDELEDGAAATTFRNRAHDLRLELQHEPIAGLRGLVGVHTVQRRFRADGEEAYVLPTETRRTGVFWLEEYRWQQWRFEAALRHDQQTSEEIASRTRRSHSGTSASLGAVWTFTPGWALATGWTRAHRAPTAEELYARGLHLATRTYERGDANLRGEVSNNVDIGLRKTAGDTTFAVSAFRNRIGRYIYGRTLDVVDGLQLLQYSQQDAVFTGLEGQVRHRLNRHGGVDWTAGLFGDVVRARLADGSALPRIAPARLGLRLEGERGALQGQVEWVQVAGQRRVAALETATPGYGMLNAGLAWRGQWQGTPWQVYLKGQNLTNRLAYAHTSYIKADAPLRGRNLVAGVRVDF